jgi:hypothetical protein
MVALLFLPFISILIPRAHELEVVSEEEEESMRRGRTKGIKTPKQPPRDV